MIRANLAETDGKELKQHKSRAVSVDTAPSDKPRPMMAGKLQRRSWRAMARRPRSNTQNVQQRNIQRTPALLSHYYVGPADFGVYGGRLVTSAAGGASAAGAASEDRAEPTAGLGHSAPAANLEARTKGFHRVWLKCWSHVGQFRRNLAEIGQCWPKFDENWPMSAECWPSPIGI